MQQAEATNHTQPAETLVQATEVLTHKGVTTEEINQVHQGELPEVEILWAQLLAIPTDPISVRVRCRSGTVHLIPIVGRSYNLALSESLAYVT